MSLLTLVSLWITSIMVSEALTRKMNPNVTDDTGDIMFYVLMLVFSPFTTIALLIVHPMIMLDRRRTQRCVPTNTQGQVIWPRL